MSPDERAAVTLEKEEEEESHEEEQGRRTGGQARRRRYINNGSNKAGRKRGIKERRKYKKRTLVWSKGRKGKRGVSDRGSVPFVLLVPDLNSSQAPLRPFGLRLTVRPASSLCHSFVLLRPLCSARFTSVSLFLCREIATRLSFMRREGRE